MKKNGTLSEVLKTGAFLLLCLALGSVFFGVPRITFPILISYVFAITLSPLLSYTRRLGLTKNVSALLMILLLLGGLVFMAVKGVILLKVESENFKFYLPRVQAYVISNFEGIQKLLYKFFKVSLGKDTIQEHLTSLQSYTTNMVLRAPNFLASVLEWFFLIPLFSFFMIKDGRSWKKTLLTLVPNRYFERVYSFVSQVNKNIGNYIFAKLLEASVVGSVILLGLIILDTRFELLLALAAGLTNIIPYIGPVLGFIPALILCLIEFGVGPKLWGVTGLYLIANLIDMTFVFPILVSSIVNLHPVTVVVSVIVGSHYFGIFGMILSIPVAVILKLFLLEAYRIPLGESDGEDSH